ncbi:putative transcriptional regulator (plasmid) [Calothrix sp. NIES-4101]|nr:putative transcriptional regulator [Calothrix sp. NIES-4101]
MTINFQESRKFLQDFKFNDLFIYQLGWTYSKKEKPIEIEIEGEKFSCNKIAGIAGAVAFEIIGSSGQIPKTKIIEAIYKKISQLYLENILIFIDGNRTQSLWYWVKRKEGKNYPHAHVYIRTQPGDLLLKKISALKVKIDDFKNITVIDIAERLQSSFGFERVSKEFFNKFQEQHNIFSKLIVGISNEVDKRWYTSVLLNRLMFVYFLERKGFLDKNNFIYLQSKLRESQARGKNLFYQQFLKVLFFEGFAKPEGHRSQETRELIGNIKYLNGGLFLKHKIEQENPNIFIPDSAFESVLNLFAKFSWNLNDTPGGNDREINPYVLGYIFEKYINQKAFGAYYTRPEIKTYLCERTINKLILNQVNQLVAPRKFDSINDLLTRLDSNLCHTLLYDILPNISLLDPACGSGAFLIAAMQTLIYIYSNIIGAIKLTIKDSHFKEQIEKEKLSINSWHFYIKKIIITNNIYGVDIMPEAVEIARLRLFLELVSSSQTVDEIELLPNINFNIMVGNSLIGLMQVNEADYDYWRGQLDLFSKTYRELIEERNRLVSIYQNSSSYTGNLQNLRQFIEQNKAEAQINLNRILLQEFKDLKIKYEKLQLNGKAKKENLELSHIENLKPFHWGYEFDEILQCKGGFDVIITNPPWEIFKPDAKDFFSQHSELVMNKKKDIKAFEKEQKKLLEDYDIAASWLEYQSQYPYVSSYYRLSEQYKNQVSVINGKKTGTDINLYKLFVERCFNLLRKGGECGIIIPSSIYTDLGTKQLREMLFSKTKIDTLFGLSNEKFIFESVHHAFKFCLLTFEKGGSTDSFIAAFRINPREAVKVNELDIFLHNQDEHIKLSIPLIRNLSPDSLSVMEFKADLDITIAEKILKFPSLGEKIDGKWNLQLTTEFHMTSDSKLFKQQPGEGRLPIYEGKMIHQFTHLYAKPRYWVDEKEGRKALLGKSEKDNEQTLDYQTYRLAYRSVRASTNERSLIATVVPPNVFFGHSINTSKIFDKTTNNIIINPSEILFVTTCFNSFIFDFLIRQRVSQNLTSLYIYQIPLPRLTKGERYFNEIVERAGKLICITPEFDSLAKEIGFISYKDCITSEIERSKIRAELDGIIANVYGLTEEEFAYILTTFPIVPEPVKIAALNAYRDVERGLIKV